VEATLEPKLVMKGEEGKPYVHGEFFVAAYQRGYRWGRHEVHQLLDDIRTNAKVAEARRTMPNDYFLQPIVVLPRGFGAWELVDGQQRLTTLMLITKYISTKLPDAHVDYSLTYETREQSREYLDTLDPELSKANIDFHHIAVAYDAIDEWFNHPNHGTPLQTAIDLHTALTKWVYVIWYQAPEGTDPTHLFTRLNRDRIALTDAELIKALVLSNNGAGSGQAGRQEEIAAQWDSFERDLRNEQLWAFLTGTSDNRPTHIDFLFETMTPSPGTKVRPRYWTFTKVFEDIAERTTADFWRDVVKRHGLVTGWYHDRLLYHRIGYLIAIGDSLSSLIEASETRTQSEFRAELDMRIRQKLDSSRSDVSLLRYGRGRDEEKCTNVLLLMNVETVLRAADEGSRFSFHAYAQDTWSLEHIHPQNAESLKTDKQWRTWLEVHIHAIEKTAWEADREAEAREIEQEITGRLAAARIDKDSGEFSTLVNRVFDLFSVAEATAGEDEMHGLPNLALLQRDFNSSLNNAVFEAKRQRIVELDFSGAYVLPCTRNVFLKYYTESADQQLHFWSRDDRDSYSEKMLNLIEQFLKPEQMAGAK
jgi:hypothetical protein